MCDAHTVGDTLPTELLQGSDGALQVGEIKVTSPPPEDSVAEPRVDFFVTLANAESKDSILVDASLALFLLDSAVYPEDEFDMEAIAEVLLGPRSEINWAEPVFRAPKGVRIVGTTRIHMRSSLAGSLVGARCVVEKRRIVCVLVAGSRKGAGFHIRLVGTA